MKNIVVQMGALPEKFRDQNKYTISIDLLSRHLSAINDAKVYFVDACPTRVWASVRHMFNDIPVEKTNLEPESAFAYIAIGVDAYDVVFV